MKNIDEIDENNLEKFRIFFKEEKPRLTKDWRKHKLITGSRETLTYFAFNEWRKLTG